MSNKLYCINPIQTCYSVMWRKPFLLLSIMILVSPCMGSCPIPFLISRILLSTCRAFDCKWFVHISHLSLDKSYVCIHNSVPWLRISLVFCQRTRLLKTKNLPFLSWLWIRHDKNLYVDFISVCLFHYSGFRISVSRGSGHRDKRKGTHGQNKKDGNHNRQQHQNPRHCFISFRTQKVQ